MAFSDIDWSQPQGSPSDYPEMTPQPPQPAPQPSNVTVMDKTWRPGRAEDEAADAPQRVRNAMWEAWTQAPDLLTPEQEQMNRTAQGPGGWIARNIVNPLSQGVGVVAGGLGALGAGATSTIAETAAAIARDPRLARDVTGLAQVAPAIGIDQPAPVVAARDFPRSPPPAEPASVAPSVMPSYTQPLVEARQAERGQVPGPTSPTNIPGPMPPPPGYTPPATPVTTVAQAKDITGQYATMNKALASQAGAVPPSVFDRVYRSIQDELPVPGPGEVFDKDNPLPGFVDELQQYKGQPMSLVQAQDLYRRMGNFISRQYTNQGLSDAGQAVLNAQQDLRYDISQSTGPNDPWSNMRAAWSQAMKMQDLQSISERAMNTNNPAQSIQNQVAAMLRSDKATRGWSDAELEGLKAIPDSSLAGDLLRGAASRLVSSGTATATGVTLGALFGPAGALAGAEGGGMLGEMVRRPFENIRRNVALGRLDNAIKTLGQGVPPAPPTGWTAPGG